MDSPSYHDDPDSDCPFCNIAGAFPSIPPLLRQATEQDGQHQAGNTGRSLPGSTLLSSVPSAFQSSPERGQHSQQEVNSTSIPEPQKTHVNGDEDPDQLWDPEKTSPPSFMVLSTPHVIAFFDIAPLTRGHVLVATRRHRIKVGDLSSFEGSEVGWSFYLFSCSFVDCVIGNVQVLC